MEEIEKKLIYELSGDIPISKRPFKEIGKRVGVSEKEIISIIKEWKKKGIIRRFGGVVSHHKIGMNANLLSAWRVEETKVEKIGALISSQREVSHCYERETHPSWRYNLYAMIHCKTEQECKDVVKRISEETNITDYILLFTDREFKKISMRYWGKEAV